MFTPFPPSQKSLNLYFFTHHSNRGARIMHHLVLVKQISSKETGVAECARKSAKQVMHSAHTVHTHSHVVRRVVERPPITWRRRWSWVERLWVLVEWRQLGGRHFFLSRFYAFCCVFPTFFLYCCCLLMKLMIKIVDSLIFFQFLRSNFFLKMLNAFCVYLLIFTFRKYLTKWKITNLPIVEFCWKCCNWNEKLIFFVIKARNFVIALCYIWNWFFCFDFFFVLFCCE